eukprot:7245748-Pyramimonas_sp.AAC.1
MRAVLASDARGRAATVAATPRRTCSLGVRGHYEGRASEALGDARGGDAERGVSRRGCGRK